MQISLTGHSRQALLMLLDGTGGQNVRIGDEVGFLHAVQGFLGFGSDHMDSLDLCKADLDSLILTIAEKYLPQLNLVMTALGIQAFATIGIIS